jgi:hypothetical protein
MKRKVSPRIVDAVSRLAATGSILILAAALSNCGGKSQPPPPALTIGPLSLPNLSVGAPNGPDGFVINANGGVAPYNWSVSAGSLPHGISLSSFPPGGPANSGFVALSGTPDTAAQGVNFTVQVTDSARQSASQAYTVAVLLNGDLVTFSTSGLDFGAQLVGTPSTQQTVTMTNISISPVIISGLTNSGSDGSEFAQTTTCGSGLAPGASCTVTEVFTPAQIGHRSASVTFTDDTPGSPQSVAMGGIGVVSGPNATWSATTVPFGSVAVGDTSLPQSVSLTNYGTSTLNITNIIASADFSETDTCGAPLAPEASCSVSVMFSPTATGSVSGTLSITDNGAGNQQSTALTGSGVAGSCKSKGQACSVAFRCCSGLQCVVTGTVGVCQR